MIKRILVKNALFTISASAVLLLTACSTQQVKQAADPAQAIKPASTVIQPSWLSQPELKQHFTAIGSALRPDHGGSDAQYLAAMENGIKQLERVFKQHHDAEQKLLTDSDVQNKNRSRSNKMLLHKVIVKEEWTNPETGRLFLWLVLPEQAAQ